MVSPPEPAAGTSTGGSWITSSCAPEATRTVASGSVSRHGPGPETLPDATVLVDSGAHELVIQLPPVDVPAAGSGGESMVGLPLCQVLVPVDASLHSSRVEVVDGSG